MKENKSIGCCNSTLTPISQGCQPQYTQHHFDYEDYIEKAGFQWNELRNRLIKEDGFRVTTPFEATLSCGNTVTIETFEEDDSFLDVKFHLRIPVPPGKYFSPKGGEQPHYEVHFQFRAHKRDFARILYRQEYNLNDYIQVFWTDREQ